MTDIGPHLLGRLPSPPDARDYRLADFLRAPVSSDAEIAAAAIAELEQTTVGYRNRYWTGQPPAGTHWQKALDLLAQIAPPPAPAPPAPAADHVWDTPEQVLDQGNFGTCVGNGWAQWGNALPIDDRFTEADARAIYYEATVIDGTPDNPDAPGGGQQGSTVRSGAQAMQNRGRLTAYAFAASVEEISAYLQAHGPVVFGTVWAADMFNPDAEGYVKPTGTVEGGHCYVAVGDLPSESAYECENSWGPGWGLAGRFKIKYADFATLLNQGGEACAAVETG